MLIKSQDTQINSCWRILFLIIKAALFAGICYLIEPTLSSFDQTQSIFTQYSNRLIKINNNYSLIHLLKEKEAAEDVLQSYTSQKPAHLEFLCKLGIENRCSMRETAEVVHLMLAVNILYTFHQGFMPLLFNYTLTFRDYLNSIGISNVLMEAIRTDMPQHYEATKPDREPWEIQITNNEFFFRRENLVNVVMKKIKDVDWEYLIWIDPHQLFTNPYWWDESIVKMEKYNAVQLFQYLTLMDTTNFTIWWKSFGFNEYAAVLEDIYYDKSKILGNAWGVRRELYEQIKRLPDTCISGCCDCAYGLAGVNDPLEKVDITFNPSQNYFNIFIDWIAYARKFFKGKHAFVRGGLLHLEHERSFHYGSGISYMNKFYDRFNFKESLHRDEDETLRIVDPDLNAFFKALTIYTNYKPTIDG